jgi:hypothetical protein
MPSVKFSTISNSVTKALEDMVEKAHLAPAYLSRVVYQTYLNAQKERWSTYNKGPNFSGGVWPELKNAADRAYKAVKYAAYPGNGTRVLVRTGKLYNSIVDRTDRNHEMVIFGSKMTVNTLVNYAPYLDQGTPKMVKRVFSEFSDSFYQKIVEDYSEYVRKAEKSDFDKFVRGQTGG